MIDGQDPEHHTSPPGAPVPLDLGPEASDLEQPLPGDTALVDKQFERWLWPHYRHNLADKILAETSPDQALRPGRSALARRWEARVAELANNPEYDEVDITDDPYQLVLEASHAAVASNPKLSELIKRLERLYKAREAHMEVRQQYEAPLPSNLDRLLEVIFEQMHY